MFDTLKNYHQQADVARANAAQFEAEAQNVDRHIAALAKSLTEEERKAYEAWLDEREKAKQKTV